MAQSSALRQAADPAPTHITINSNNVPNPKNADVPSGGSVQFNAANACWLYFAPTGVFGDSNGRLELSQGNTKDWLTIEEAGTGQRWPGGDSGRADGGDGYRRR